MYLDECGIKVAFYSFSSDILIGISAVSRITSVILSSCPFVLLSFCPLVLLSSCHPVLLSSCQLVNLWAFRLAHLGVCELFFWYFDWHFDRPLALICSSEIWRERKMHPTTFSRNPKTFSWKHAGRENRIPPHFPGKKCICLFPPCSFCNCCWSEKVKTKHKAHICHNRWLFCTFYKLVYFFHNHHNRWFLYFLLFYKPKTQTQILPITLSQ